MYKLSYYRFGEFQVEFVSYMMQQFGNVYELSCCYKKKQKLPKW